MTDMYIVVRGLSESEDGRWYNISRMSRLCEFGSALRGSTRESPDAAAAAYLPGTRVSLEATGVLEFGQYGGVAEVYRPIR